MSFFLSDFLSLSLLSLVPLAESLPPVLLLPPSPEGEDELSDEVDEVDVFEPLSPDVEPDDEDELSDVVDVVVVLVPLSPDVEDGLSVGVGMVVVFDPLSPDGEPDGEPGSEDEVSPELAGGAVEKLVEADGSGAGAGGGVGFEKLTSISPTGATGLVSTETDAVTIWAVAGATAAAVGTSAPTTVDVPDWSEVVTLP